MSSNGVGGQIRSLLCSTDPPEPLRLYYIQVSSSREAPANTVYESISVGLARGVVLQKVRPALALGKQPPLDDLYCVCVRQGRAHRFGASK